MKPDIHPNYHPVVFRDRNTGKEFFTRSTVVSEESIEWHDGNTYPLIHVDISSDSHPFWTGTAKVIDNEGRVAAFERRYGGKK